MDKSSTKTLYTWICAHTEQHIVNVSLTNKTPVPYIVVVWKKSQYNMSASSAKTFIHQNGKTFFWENVSQ